MTPKHGTWFVWHGKGESQCFDDPAHGGDELRSLHAAFLWAKEAP